MRRSLSIIAVALLISLAGCSGSHHDAPVSGKLTLMLEHDSTAAQHDALQRKLESLPALTGVTFVDRHHAYERLKTSLGGDDANTLDGLTEANMPESFEVTVTDGTFTEAVAAAVHAEPGVQDILTNLSQLPLTHGVIVDVTDSGPGLESAIKQFPNVKSVRFESAADALARLKKRCKGDKALSDALTPATVSASYRFVYTESSADAGKLDAALSKLNDNKPILGVPTSVL